MKSSVVVQCSWLGDPQHSIEETLASQEKEKIGGIEKHLGT